MSISFMQMPCLHSWDRTVGSQSVKVSFIDRVSEFHVGASSLVFFLLSLFGLRLFRRYRWSLFTNKEAAVHHPVWWNCLVITVETERRRSVMHDNFSWRIDWNRNIYEQQGPLTFTVHLENDPLQATTLASALSSKPHCPCVTLKYSTLPRVVFVTLLLFSPFPRTL